MENGGFERADREETSDEKELDLPPELCQYRDEGCELAAACLDCPFKRCVYDEPGERTRLLRRWRNREMVNLFRAEKKSARELARMFKVSRRTVERVLKDSRL